MNRRTGPPRDPRPAPSGTPHSAPPAAVAPGTRRTRRRRVRPPRRRWAEPRRPRPRATSRRPAGFVVAAELPRSGRDGPVERVKSSFLNDTPPERPRRRESARRAPSRIPSAGWMGRTRPQDRWRRPEARRVERSTVFSTAAPSLPSVGRSMGSRPIVDFRDDRLIDLGCAEAQRRGGSISTMPRSAAFRCGSSVHIFIPSP